MGGVPEHFNLPWHLAIESGAFQDARVSVEFIEVPGGTGAMARMLKENQLDAAIMLTEGAVADICNGSSNRLVKVYAESPLIWGIHVASDSSIQTVDEIQGKRYAISRSGSGSHLMAIVDASERGWPTDDIEFVKIKNLEGARKALAEDEVDVFLWEKYMTKPLVDSGEFRRVGNRVVPWPSFVVSVRYDFLTQRTSEIKRALEVVQFYAQMLQQNANAFEFISQRYHLKRDDTKEWLDSTRWCTDFEKPTKQLVGVLNYLKRLEIIPPDDRHVVEDLWFDLQSV